jgi:TolB protein
MNTDGTGILGLTDRRMPVDDGHPTWSPDGKQIAFEQVTDDGLNSEIWIVNADGTNAHSLHQSGRYPTWSPNGKYIAFSSNRTGRANIYLVNPDGSDLVRLTGTGGVFLPAWSPDSKQIVYSAQFNDHVEAYIMGADGTNATRITNNASRATDYDGNFSWSPDGRQFVFQSARSGHQQLYVMNTDGSNMIQLTDTTSNDRDPVWSPDGKYIAFDSDRAGPSPSSASMIPISDVYVMNADGTDTMRLTTNAMDNGSPVWQP